MMTPRPPLAEQSASALPQAELDALTDQLIEKLKTVFDPEIPVDIYELGLIYKVDVSDDKAVAIDMTLTAPGCPVAGEMPGWVRDAVLHHSRSHRLHRQPGVRSAVGPLADVATRPSSN